MRLRALVMSMAAGLMAVAAHAAPNLVTNGDFEANGGVGQMYGGISYATGWTVSAALDGASSPFAFMVDMDTADAATSGFSGGFASVNSASLSTNIYLWGSNNGGLNTVTNSDNGGMVLGVDGGYAMARVSQDISGLTVGQSYTLSFEWAAGQFTDQLGDFYAGWDVTFGSDTQSVTSGALGSISGQGFRDWTNASMTFTATAATQTLSFLATGPTGLPPFSLLDGVVLSETTPPPSPVPEPATLGMMLAGGALLGAAKRRRQRSAK